MTELELQGITYRVGKLDAFKQLHVSRRIAPIIPPLIPVFMEIAAGGTNPFEDSENLAESLQPFTDALANMKDSEAEYVIGTCLSVVQRKNGQGWANVWNVQGNCSMFDDMDMSVMLPLVIQVVKDNLGSFMNGLLTKQANLESSPT